MKTIQQAVQANGKKNFRFEIKGRRIPPATEARRIHVELDLTQQEFEDYQYVRKLIQDKALSLGFELGEYAWLESPVYEPEFLAALSSTLGLGDHHELIGYYPHGWQHRHYKTVLVGDHVVRHQSSGVDGRFVSFALAVPV